MSGVCASFLQCTLGRTAVVTDEIRASCAVDTLETTLAV